MTNVDDLMNRPQTQSVTISAIKEDTSVNINSTNGLTGAYDEPVTSKPTININPRRKPHHRNSDGGFEAAPKEVNPDDFMPKAAPKKSETVHERALGELANAVARKKKEFHDFVEAADEMDKENRERVEAGLETVNGELQYMPDELHVPITEEEMVSPEKAVQDIIANDDTMPDPFEEDRDDFEFEDTDDFEALEAEMPSSPVVRQSSIVDPDSFDNLDNFSSMTDNDFFDDDDRDFLTNDLVEDEEEEEYPEEETEEMEEEPVQDIIANDDDPVPVRETVNVEVPMEQEPIVAPDVEEEPHVMEKYDGGIFSKPINVTGSALSNPISEATTDDFDIDEEDLEGVAENNSIDDDLSDEEVMKISAASEKHLKSEILQKIIQAGKHMDTTQFVVSNKVINIKDAMKNSANTKLERTAIWPLTYAGRPYKASALKGPEIAMLADADNSESNGGVGLTIDQAKILFEHDANPYRPSTVEAWAKTIPYSDVENIFAALYVASLKDSNYIPMACPKNSCQYAYLSENVDINDMIKFDTDEAKKRFDEVKKMEITPENTGSYESVVNVINDNYAIGFKVPSIFTILYEYDALNADFIRKYTAMVSIIQYIDYIYYIDPESQQFQPIGWKTYPGDHGKSFKSKIATYSKILKEMDDTDFTVMIALINSMINKIVDERHIKYEIPATKCPKCGANIEAREINARGLVFMRQRLVELATTPSAK